MSLRELQEAYPCERNAHMATAPTNIDYFPTLDIAPGEAFFERIEMPFYCSRVSRYEQTIE
jgi:hypothetical protein